MTFPYTRALVTGASGFVGTNLCQALLTAGVNVAAIGLPGKSLEKNLSNEKISFHQGDVADASFVDRVTKTVQPEVVFHLAAYGTFGHEQDTARMIDVNISGTRYLLASAQAVGCRMFVHAGSIKEYAPSQTLITEETPLYPWDDYAATKAAAGFFCRLAAVKHTLPTTLIRLSPVYGPGDTPTRFVISAIRAATRGTPFNLSVGPLLRNFTYIDDVVAAFLQASRRSGEQYVECNVTASDAHSFSDILDAVELATGKKISRIITTPDATLNDSWIVDNQAARRLLNWEPQIALDEGIRRTVEWYRKQN